MTGRGLHYTTAAGVYADVWQWKATSTGPSGWMDDDHFGPPLEPTPMQVQNVAPYRGGFEPDPGTANYSDNFDATPDPADRDQSVKPRRLPKDLVATTRAMGADQSRSGGRRKRRCALVHDRCRTPSRTRPRWTVRFPSAPSFPASSYPVNFPAIAPTFDARRDGPPDIGRSRSRAASIRTANLTCRSRRGVFMRVAAFDHSQIGHTRHVRPIRIEVE